MNEREPEVDRPRGGEVAMQAEAGRSGERGAGERDADAAPRRAIPPVADVGAGRALRRVGAQLRKAAIRFRLGQKWEQSEDGFSRRVYPSYEAYIDHQKTKFDAARAKFIRNHDARFHAALSERLAASGVEVAGRSVLCIAARQGTEVRAFIDAGAFAVGIDLNPGRENRYVVVGDFHALQYGDGTVDIAYTNSLDHAFDLDRVLDEVRRVLKPDGVLLAELNGGEEKPSDAGFYESSGWASVDAMIERLGSNGFAAQDRSSFEVPWPGELVVLRRA